MNNNDLPLGTQLVVAAAFVIVTYHAMKVTDKMLMKVMDRRFKKWAEKESSKLNPNWLQNGES